MKQLFTILFASLFLVTAMAAVCPDVADAARLGGGRSFGSQPSMSSPAKNPMQYNRQATPGQTQSGAQAGRPGLGVGGGLLGGLLACSLIGGLLGGHGLAGGMGGLLDIILLVVVIMLIVSFVRKRRQAAAYQAAGRDPYQDYQQGQQTQYGQQNYQGAQGSAWDQLRSGPQGGGTVSYQSNIPAGFDVDNFLKGAKMAYTRMQASWDKRDLEDISHFATDAIMRELQRQMAEDPNPGRTQIVMLNATLVNVEEFGSQDRAQVYFDALLIEDPRQTQPSNARELWTFVREHQSGNWKFDGLQQIEGC